MLLVQSLLKSQDRQIFVRHTVGEDNDPKKHKRSENGVLTHSMDVN